MAFIDDLNDVSTEEDGEKVSSAIVKCLSFLQGLYYPSVDISDELNLIQGSTEGSKIRIAIHDALLKMSRVDDAMIPDITELTQAEYDALDPPEDILYGIRDSEKVYVTAVNPATNESLSETLSFDTTGEAVDYVRNNADTDKFYGIKGSSLTTSIGYEEFVTLGGLIEYVSGDNETTIGERAFAGCDGLTNIELPNTLTSIGAKAFEGCIGLESITIPSSVQTIAENAFISTGITRIIVNASEDAIENAPWGATGAAIYWIGDE